MSFLGFVRLQAVWGGAYGAVARTTCVYGGTRSSVPLVEGSKSGVGVGTRLPWVLKSADDEGHVCKKYRIY